ncbi:hypothetical protein [Micromonospora siamensis]|uniref:Uncharacterized protein n=1 Tax=Micromonospora siamensis TaxID=299152 RepID=A0A1C5K6R1_9ACTN|nr:hypothetical protein [Micromonospora siamensis]SCG78136.1 hypothetical protein GA0074704_5575 [Micromonospora siamensis]
MANRTWGRPLLTALGASVLAGAGQLGIAYGFGIVRLTGAFTDGSVNRWPAQLVWVGWFAAIAAVTGAVVTERLARRDGPPAETAQQLAVAGAAALGSTVVAPLCMQPARAADLLTVDPVWAVGICAVLGAVAGAAAALAVLVRPPLGWNVALVAAAVWLLAVVSVAPSLAGSGPLPTVRLGVLEPSWLAPDAAERLAMLILPAVALLGGAATGALARWRGEPPLVSGGSGAAGPVLVAFAYLSAGPGETVDRYQLAPYYGALIAVAAGVLGSTAATLLRWPLLSTAGTRQDTLEPTDILRPLPTGAGLPAAETVATRAPASGPAATDLFESARPVPGATPPHWDWPATDTQTATPGARPVTTAAGPTAAHLALDAPATPGPTAVEGSTAPADGQRNAPGGAHPPAADTTDPSSTPTAPATGLPGDADEPAGARAEALTPAVTGVGGTEPDATTDGQPTSPQTSAAGTAAAPASTRRSSPARRRSDRTTRATGARTEVADGTTTPAATAAEPALAGPSGRTGPPSDPTADVTTAGDSGGDAAGPDDVPGAAPTTAAPRKELPKATPPVPTGRPRKGARTAGRTAAGPATPPAAVSDATGPVATSQDVPADATNEGATATASSQGTAASATSRSTEVDASASAATKPETVPAVPEAAPVAATRPKRPRGSRAGAAAGPAGGAATPSPTVPASGDTDPAREAAGQPGPEPVGPDTTAPAPASPTVAFSGLTGQGAGRPVPVPAWPVTPTPATLPPAADRGARVERTEPSGDAPAPRPRHRAPLPDLDRAGNWDAFGNGFRRTAPEAAAPGVAARPAGEEPSVPRQAEGPAEKTEPATAEPAAERPRQKRGLFRRNRPRPAEPAAVPPADEPLPAKDEEYVDWVTGLAKPTPEAESGGSERRSLRSTGRHHRD